MTTKFENLYLNGTCYADILNGNVIYSNGYIQPSAGSGNNGIIFSPNPGGGGGDTAFIKYYAYDGEACELLIQVENDSNDYITLQRTRYDNINTFVQLGDNVKLSAASGSVIIVGFDNYIYMQGHTTTSVKINASNGSSQTDWPSGWGGGLATFDICCASIRYSGLSQRSDLKYKENIGDIQNCLKDITKLRPVTFNWKKEVSFYNPDVQYGFIAQDVEKIFPKLINEDNNGYKSVNSSAFVPMLVKCVQEQQEQIQSLEERIKKLEELIKS